jgi:hypothetical protein
LFTIDEFEYLSVILNFKNFKYFYNDSFIVQFFQVGLSSMFLILSLECSQLPTFL